MQSEFGFDKKADNEKTDDSGCCNSTEVNHSTNDFTGATIFGQLKPATQGILCDVLNAAFARIFPINIEKDLEPLPNFTNAWSLSSSINNLLLLIFFSNGDFFKSHIKIIS